MFNVSFPKDYLVVLVKDFIVEFERFVVGVSSSVSAFGILYKSKTESMSNDIKKR